MCFICLPAPVWTCISVGHFQEMSGCFHGFLPAPKVTNVCPFEHTPTGRPQMYFIAEKLRKYNKWRTSCVCMLLVAKFKQERETGVFSWVWNVVGHWCMSYKCATSGFVLLLHGTQKMCLHICPDLPNQTWSRTKHPLVTGHAALVSFVSNYWQSSVLAVQLYVVVVPISSSDHTGLLDLPHICFH